MKNKGVLSRWLGKQYKKLWFLALLSVALTSVFQLITLIPFIQDLEDKTIDYRFRLAPRPERADSNIVMLAIDDKTLKFAQDFKQGWPFPREFYALVTRYLEMQGAKAVIYDMQYYEPDFDRGDIDSASSDSSFATSMLECGKVFIGAQLVPEANSTSNNMERQALAIQDIGKLKIPEWKGILEPIELFSSSAAGLGIINVGEGREAIVRRMPLLYKLNGKYYPNLAFTTWMRNTGNLENLAMSSTGLQVDSLTIPMDKNGNFTINWYGKGDAEGVFKYYSFAAVLQSAVARIYETGDPSLKDGVFADKYVIIGAKAAGLMDLKSSPYTWSVPGMEIWATILSNLRQQDFITTATPAINWLICLVLVFMVLVAITRLKSGMASGILISLFVLIIAGSILAFQIDRYLINLIVPVIAYFTTWIFITTISFMMEGRHKKELRMLFTRYLHPDVVQRIVDHPDMVQMGGEEFQATVMFSDIYNFTGFSENKSPTEIVSYLNEYFSSFTNSILDHNGLLDKYTGDGLMAVFGVPIAREDHAVSACRAALAHRDYSLTFKDQPDLTPTQQFHLNTRLGIHSGVVVAGNIGSERRMEYTSIGDTVNLSARLEGVNKVFHTYIIISEATYLQVKDVMLCRELDYLRVKGKKEPTRIYELVAEKANSEGLDFGWITQYEKALQLYRAGDWEQAAVIFATLAATPGQDSAALTMLQRCRFLLANPPETWDGILTLEEK